jgi:hypothetical protein
MINRLQELAGLKEDATSAPVDVTALGKAQQSSTAVTSSSISPRLGLESKDQ